MAAPLESPRSLRGHELSSFRTLNEAELSESLVYLSCPICEEVRPYLAESRDCLLTSLSLCVQVVSQQPMFTPCHHTFCDLCIRNHLKDGYNKCPECKRPLSAAQLQPNKMAEKLLSTMKAPPTTHACASDPKFSPRAALRPDVMHLQAIRLQVDRQSYGPDSSQTPVPICLGRLPVWLWCTTQPRDLHGTPKRLRVPSGAERVP